MKEPPKITYLLGAGASYNALPIVNELASVADEIIKHLIHYKTSYPNNIKNYSDFSKTISLIKEVAKHHSIDTLARKIWIKNKGSADNDEYIRIINLITAILYFKQIEKNILGYDNISIKRKSPIELVIDPRYEAFFAAILKDDCSIPHNFSFISWNYDFQIEKALHFYSDKRISETAEEYKIIYDKSRPPNKTTQIIKINGTSLFESNNNVFDSTICNHEIYSILIDALSDNMERLKNTSSLIKFAWENEPEIKNHHAIASEKIKDSDFVVVIGYSFPIFNRAVDIELFKYFEKGKIIIQAPESDVHQYIQQLESIKSNLSEKAIPITNLNQFYIPNEYWTEPKTKGNRAKVF
ncbi:MAG: hypothetical protein V4538_10300 [Bacteroidota bacterium]